MEGLTDLPCYLAGGFWRYTGRNKKCFVPAVPLMTAKLLMPMRSDAHDAVGAWASPDLILRREMHVAS